MDVLRLLCWCQNVRPDDLSSISTETERENLITLGLIKRHQRSDTLLLTNSGRAFLQAALEGDVPNLTLSYHDAAIERRVRLSSLMMTAYHAGINVFTITANSLAEPSTLFITAITRSRGHNPWGSARVGAIAHLGSTYYAVHYIYSGIGRMAVNDELAAFHNHTNFGKDTQRAFLFAGASYADIMEELKARDEKRDAKLIRYSEAYRGLHYPVHLLSCDETGARQLQIMAVPDYRVKISKLMLRSAYRPPPEDAPAWDATYQNRPFVIGADMNLRRIDAAIASAKKRGCLPISLAALDAQGDAVLLRRYKDTGYAVIYILEILKEFKYLRVRQLHAMVRTHYRAQGIEIDARRMEIMLRQMRTGTNYVWLRGDVVSYGDRRIDPRLLEALDVMLELTKAQPGFYSKDGLHEPFLLRFTGNGKGAGYLFSVAWLDAATHIATVPRMKGERIIWISESNSFGEINLPRHHFFAVRQEDGTHRFFGSNEPGKI